MNVGRVLTLVQEIRELDNTLGVQGRFEKLREAAQNLAGEPQNQSHQQNFVARLKELRTSLIQEAARLTTGQKEFLVELNCLHLFSEGLADQIQENIRDNGIAPSVVQRLINEEVEKRNRILSNFAALIEALGQIGVKRDELQPGEAEVSFILPRSLFANSLKGLSKEIDFIDKAVRAFSEAVGEDAHEPEIKQLSTSDPIVTVSACIAVVAAIGKTIEWLLGSYKTTLEIKRMRNEASAAGMKQEVISAYEERADEIIKCAIDERVKQIMQAYSGPKERAQELQVYLRWALESFVWKIERGLRVEVRYLAPPQAAQQTPESEKEQALFKELSDVQSRLNYPTLHGDPITQLPPPEPTRTEKPPRQRKPTSSGPTKRKKSGQSED